MTELALIAAAEIDAAFVLAVTEWYNGGEEMPDPSLYGLSEEEGAKLAAETLAVVLSDDGAAEMGSWFDAAAEAEFDAAWAGLQKTG